MASMTKPSEKSLEKNDLICKWCDREFRTERTLSAHMCVRKRRWADRDMTHTRLAYRVFQMFYELNVASSKPKSQEDFVRSQYYEGFTKFGRACVRNQYLDPEAFAEWLIRNGKKLSDWCKDAVYDEYLLHYVKKEPGARALERTILYLAEWSTESGEHWQDYFRVVSTPRAVHDIRSGRISPWLIYLSDSGDSLLTRLSDEQIGMISKLIDAKFWFGVFAHNDEQVELVRSACEAAGI
jgi:hypothetical protein